MPKILPSQVVDAIESRFGAPRNELAVRAIHYKLRAEIHALLALLDEVPRELIDLSWPDYLEFVQCRAVLSTALADWNAGGIFPVSNVGGKDPIERIRRLMLQCHDEVPEPESELLFIADIEARRGVEKLMQAAWVDYGAREWIGATLFAATATETLLLWCLKQPGVTEKTEDKLNRMTLDDLIKEAVKSGQITEASATQANLARDFRNLVHAGRVNRTGRDASKATAFTAHAALHCVIDDLRSKIKK